MYQINDYLVSQYGIFQAIYSKNDTRINWLTEDISKILDLEYYVGVSGNKYITPLVERLYDFDSDTYLSKIADIFILRFADNLKHIYDALNINYNPLNNYDMVEDENVGSEIKTDLNNNYFGFNGTSDDGEKVNKNSSTTSGDYEKNKRKLTRSGNIGVTSSQDLLNAELETRKYNFYKYVYKCIDSIMCLDVR